MLRRLEKRILVDLPTVDAREAMFKHHLPLLITPESHGLELRAEVDYKSLAMVCRTLTFTINRKRIKKHQEFFFSFLAFVVPHGRVI